MELMVDRKPRNKYEDERINEFIKQSFEVAFQDEEWTKGLRCLDEWDILYEDIDKMLEYVKNGKQGKLFVDSNIWWVLQDALMNILELYDLQLIGEDRVTDNEEVVTKYANYMRCRIEYENDKTQLEVIIKANDEVIDEEDEKIFFYGLSLMDIQDLIRTQNVVENEWRILEILDVMEDLYEE